MFEVLKAAEILEEKYGVAADVWSVTSYKELYRDANDCERWNMLHPARAGEGSVRDANVEGRSRTVSSRRPII
jgi:pyruvate dehydrogenase E1 component